MVNISSTLPQVQPKLANNNISFKSNNNFNISFKALTQDTVSFSGVQERKLSDFEAYQQNRKALFTEFRSQMYDGKVTKEFAQNLLNKKFPDYPIVVKEERGEAHSAVKSELSFYKGKPEQTITLNLDKIEEAQQKPDRNAKGKPIRGKAIANIASDFQCQALTNSVLFENIENIEKITAMVIEKTQKDEDLNPIKLAEMILENSSERCINTLGLDIELDYSSPEDKVNRIVSGLDRLFGEGAGQIIEGFLDKNNEHLTDSQKILASIDFKADPDVLAADVAQKLTKMLCYSSVICENSPIASNPQVKQAFSEILATHKDELNQILSMEDKAEAREKLLSVDWFNADNAKDQFDAVIFSSNKEKSKSEFNDRFNGDIDAYTVGKQKVTLNQTLGTIVSASKMESHLMRAGLNAEESFYGGKNKLSAEELLPLMYEKLGNYAASQKGKANIDAIFERYGKFLVQ